MDEVPVLTGREPPISDGFDLPFYNGYAVDVAALLSVYALITYFLTLWPTWVCCAKIRGWKSYKKWLVIAMLFIELLHVIYAFLTLDSYRDRETTLGNRTPPHWTLQWTFFTTAIAVLTVQATVVYVVHGVCRIHKLIAYAATTLIVGPFIWSFYTIFIWDGKHDLASYASFISQASVMPILGDVVVVSLLTYYILRNKPQYNKAFIHAAEFIQPVLCSFVVFRALLWFIVALFRLPSFGFVASAMKLGGLEIIGNLYPVLLIVAVNTYEDAYPRNDEEHWQNFRLAILVPVLAPPELESA